MKISSAVVCGPLFLLLCLTPSISNAEVQRPIVFQRPLKGGKSGDASKIAPPGWVVKGVKTLTMNMLHDIYQYEGSSFNIVLCPVSVWTILVMLHEAAAGDTEKELKNSIGIRDTVPSKDVQQTMRFGYIRLKKLLQVDGNATEFSSINFLVSDKKKSVAPEYDEVIRSMFEGRNFAVDFKDKVGTAKMINDWAKQSTKERISSIITPSEMNDLSFLIGNAVFFKGRWKYPFNISLTTLDQFKDENDEIKNEVSMMTQRTILPYGYNAKLESQIVEIPYADDATSMIVILPRRKVKFMDVLSKMKTLPLEDIIPENLTEDEVELHLPRFSVHSNMYLNKVLNQYVPKIFSPAYADLPKLSKDVFVSKIAHRAEIENSEEGTTASAITSAQVAYKTTTVRFHANRPFIYLINDKKSRTILFAGTISNPSAI